MSYQLQSLIALGLLALLAVGTAEPAQSLQQGCAAPSAWDSAPGCLADMGSGKKIALQ